MTCARAIALLAVVAVALAGCGGGGASVSPDEERAQVLANDAVYVDLPAGWVDRIGSSSSVKPGGTDSFEIPWNEALNVFERPKDRSHIDTAASMVAHVERSGWTEIEVDCTRAETGVRASIRITAIKQIDGVPARLRLPVLEDDRHFEAIVTVEAPLVDAKPQPPEERIPDQSCLDL